MIKLIPLLRPCEFVCSWSKLWLVWLFLPDFSPCLRCALLSSQLLLVHLLVVQDVVKILDQLLLASYSVDFSSWDDVENVVYKVSVWVLIFAKI